MMPLFDQTNASWIFRTQAPSLNLTVIKYDYLED